MSDWPELLPALDHDTFYVLHLAAQMLGKIRVANAPWTNHGWHVALQPVANGFETLPTASGDGRTFTLRLDLCAHAIVLWVSDENRDQVPLELGSVASIHRELVALLRRHGLPERFNESPNELKNPVRFRDDIHERSYSREAAERLRCAFAAMLPAFEWFRAAFSGKASPVHFWWGSFDLAVSRFSGRKAPVHPGGVVGLPDRVTREAYSDEVASCGFWAGGAIAAEPFFYSYIYPEPEGYRLAKLAQGQFDEAFGEFVLNYATVRRAADPAAVLTEFLQTTYEAASDLAKWDRKALEREPVAP